MDSSVQMWIWISIAALVIWLIYFIPTFNALVHLREALRNTGRMVGRNRARKSRLYCDLYRMVKDTIGHGERALQTLRKPLTGKQLIAVAERIPTLPANETFVETVRQYARTEQAIVDAEGNYSSMMERYNTLCRRFPSCIVAWLGGFKPVDKIGEEGGDER